MWPRDHLPQIYFVKSPLGQALVNVCTELVADHYRRIKAMRRVDRAGLGARTSRDDLNKLDPLLGAQLALCSRRLLADQTRRPGHVELVGPVQLGLTIDTTDSARICARHSLTAVERCAMRSRKAPCASDASLGLWRAQDLKPIPAVYCCIAN